MLNTRTWYLMTALALLLAAIEPTSASLRARLNDSAPLSASAADYLIASKASLQQASEHRRLNETPAACEALAKSLDYYRIALEKELLDKLARPAKSEEGDGMQEIRTRFGCASSQPS